MPVPTNNQSKGNADSVTNEQESISRKWREWLLRFLAILHDRASDRFGTVSVMIKVFAQPSHQVPHANHKQRKHDRTAQVTEGFPQMRPNHGNKKCGKEQRYSRKH